MLSLLSVHLLHQWSKQHVNTHIVNGRLRYLIQNTNIIIIIIIHIESEWKHIINQFNWCNNGVGGENDIGEDHKLE